MDLCIFDLDGTLLDTLTDLADSVNWALVRQRLSPHPVEEYRYFVGNGMSRLIERASGHSSGSQLYEQVFRDFTRRYAEHSMDRTVAYEGARELLEKLQTCGMQLAVFSNKEENYIVGLLAHYFPSVQFAIYRGKSARFPAKPDPAGLQDILLTLQRSVDQTVYVGDSDVDVDTAHRAGLKIIGAGWGFRGMQELRRAGADFLAESPQDVLLYLDKLNAAFS